MVAGEGVSGGAVAKNDNNSSTKDGERTFDDMRMKCHRCMEPGHRLHRALHSSTKKSQNGSGEIIGCLAIGMLRKKNAVRERESKDGTETWIGDRWYWCDLSHDQIC